MWVLVCIGYFEQFVLVYGMGVEGNFVGCFVDVFKVDVGFELLVVFGYYVDQVYGYVGCGVGGGDDGIEYWFWWCI